MRMKILRPLLGIILIVLSVLALLWWENTGREQLLMSSVMVAKGNIQRGTIIGEQNFVEIKNISESTIPGSITPKSFYKIKGLVAKQYIPKLSQVIPKMFMRKDKILLEGNSIFPIKDVWIDSRSSSLRKGDTIDIFDESGQCYVGTFPIAYVKDSNEQEVVGTEENHSEEVLQRDFSSSIISRVEIITSLEEYKKIWELAEKQSMKLLLIQKGENIYE